MNIDKLLVLVILCLSLSFWDLCCFKVLLYKEHISLHIILLNFLSNFTFSLNVVVSAFPPLYPWVVSVHLGPLISDLEFDSPLYYWTFDSDRFHSNYLCFQKYNHITWKYHLNLHFLRIKFFLFLLWVG